MIMAACKRKNKYVIATYTNLSLERTKMILSIDCKDIWMITSRSTIAMYKNIRSA